MKIAMLSFAHSHAYTYASILAKTNGIEIATVVDEDKARGTDAAKRYGAMYVRDYQTALQDPELDAVVICSENARHKAMVMAAAEAGKHVLCEKPIATNVDDAWAMVNACKARNVILQTAFPIRFSPPIQRVKSQIDAGDIGRIVAMSGTNRGQNPGGWFVDKALSGGGAVMDHTVHVLDIMRWYLESEVCEVYAEIDTRFSTGDIDDCGLLMLRFANGVIASHDPSWSRPKTFPTWGDVTLRLIGTSGQLDVDAFRQHLVVYDDNRGPSRHMMWGDSGDELMVKHFLHCIQTGSEPLTTGLDGLRAMEVALAAYESAHTKRPIQLSASRE